MQYEVITRDAPPQHYWYSRIDTRDSTIASVYMEPGVEADDVIGTLATRARNNFV